jgi:hypothetical protein
MYLRCCTKLFAARLPPNLQIQIVLTAHGSIKASQRASLQSPPALTIGLGITGTELYEREQAELYWSDERLRNR